LPRLEDSQGAPGAGSGGPLEIGLPSPGRPRAQPGAAVCGACRGPGLARLLAWRGLQSPPGPGPPSAKMPWLSPPANGENEGLAGVNQRLTPSTDAIFQNLGTRNPGASARQKTRHQGLGGLCGGLFRRACPHLEASCSGIQATPATVNEPVSPAPPAPPGAPAAPQRLAPAAPGTLRRHPAGASPSPRRGSA